MQKSRIVLLFSVVLLAGIIISGCCNNVEEIAGTSSALPLGVFFVADSSGSISGEMDYLKDGVKSFVQNMDPLKDYAELIDFDSSVNVVYPFDTINKDVNSNGLLDICDEVDNMYASGSTYLWDAAYQGVTDAIPDTASFAVGVIVLSDGGDSGSTYTVQQVIDLAVANSIPVYSIALGTSADSNLRKLAEDTGGKYYEAADGSILVEIYNQLYEEIDASRMFGIW